MKTLAYLRAKRACQISDVPTTSATSTIPTRKQLAGWAGALMLLLTPALILATTGESQANSSCRGRYRSVGCSSKHHRHGSYCGGLSIGSSGPAVALLQEGLTGAGFPVGIDGVFGFETDQAVRAFQASSGLAPDGCVGPATAQALRYDNRVASRRPINCDQPRCRTPVPLPTPIGPVVRETLRFVVAIPSDNPEKLFRVQRFVPGAFFASSRLGTYINAGSFVDRAPAEARASELQAFGIDAQVRHRDF
ncbi:peptidoglycan-binding protein [Kovacikia minuta CCNUW1]|uniref:peptidoglycan-binding domain-containing protein n=1 Tax=Kovacikia minuta TaxID=2931930 RepID=UPI001CCEFFC3|nr:peptidoglycan-binding domain-containing protein [Kovacikia minuta]UBF28910.1 peptidoglycan-binding protein [Kovacikia minuta CCNUW1]